MEFYCNQCDRTFEKEAFTVLGIPMLPKDSLEQIKETGTAYVGSGLQTCAIAGITCTHCESMVFMAARAAIEKGLIPKFQVWGI